MAELSESAPAWTAEIGSEMFAGEEAENEKFGMECRNSGNNKVFVIYPASEKSGQFSVLWRGAMCAHISLPHCRGYVPINSL